MRPLYLLLAAATLCIAADTVDPGGWTAAKWGMTDAELLTAFPGQAVRFPVPDKVNHATVGIESLELAGIAFKVYLCPDDAGRLTSVLLTPARRQDHTDAIFQSLEQSLVQKYGHPWKSTEGERTEIQWTFKTTVIALSRSRIPAIGTQLVHLEYKKKSTDLDKM